MSMMRKTLLIGGTSHLGKSTLAQQLADTLSAELISTDQLARHPGRPWKASIDFIPPHVIEHYEQLNVDELIEDVLAHYQKQWPTIQGLIEDSTSPFLIIEGSAIGPSWVVEHLSERIKGIWLVAASELVQTRIYQNSQFEERSSREKLLIDKFCRRSIQFNELIKAGATRFSLPYLEVDFNTTRTALVQRCLREVGWTLET